MNLRPIFPSPTNGLRVQCVTCSQMHCAATVMADLDAPAGTFYCPACVPPVATEEVKCDEY